MDIKAAATNMIPLIESAGWLPNEHAEFGKDHLMSMVSQIQTGEIKDEKAHRWLGWIQGCVCVGRGATLKQMKRINREA